jgi:hypothetical protein
MALSSYQLFRLQYPEVNLDRSPELTGYDIAFEPEGDLLTNRGDLVLSSGVELITTALIRRMSTPPGGYSRYLLTLPGVVYLNEGYDNQLYLRLSSPITQELIDGLVLDIQQAANAEPRIENLSITASFQYNTVTLDFTYRILSDPELRELKAKLTSL